MATVQIRGKGNVTIPARVRKKYGLNEGDTFTVIDMGEGCLLLTPRVSGVEKLGDRIARILAKEKISEEEMIRALDEERERFYRERYAKR
jgi:AbrB family looped-hinge helix DNA binding protein